MIGPTARLRAWADAQPAPNPKLTEALWAIGITQTAVVVAVAAARPRHPLLAVAAAQPLVLWAGLHAGYQTPA